MDLNGKLDEIFDEEKELKNEKVFFNQKFDLEPEPTGKVFLSNIEKIKMKFNLTHGKGKGKKVKKNKKNKRKKEG